MSSQQTAVPTVGLHVFFGGSNRGDSLGTNDNALLVTAVVTESLADTRFRVRLETGSEAIVYLAGKLRRFNIRVVPGDTVDVELSPYDLSRGRIVYRQR